MIGGWIKVQRYTKQADIRWVQNPFAEQFDRKSLCSLVKVGDIVLCKVNGKQYLHLVKAIQGKRYQIGNNRGRINGGPETDAAIRYLAQALKVQNPQVRLSAIKTLGRIGPEAKPTMPALIGVLEIFLKELDLEEKMDGDLQMSLFSKIRKSGLGKFASFSDAYSFSDTLMDAMSKSTRRQKIFFRKPSREKKEADSMPSNTLDATVGCVHWAGLGKPNLRAENRKAAVSSR